MGTRVVRVAINGYGVIGKRVADGVSLQDDMTLAGVADVVTDYRIRMAVARGYPLFASTPDAWDAMRQAGLPVKGRLEDLLSQTDVVVDCTPKKVAAKNRDLYATNRVKSIFQGGEKHELTGYSFVATANYAGALGRDTLRVVSCNTTGLCRIAQGFHARGLINASRGPDGRRPWAWETDWSEGHSDTLGRRPPAVVRSGRSSWPAAKASGCVRWCASCAGTTARSSSRRS